MPIARPVLLCVHRTLLVWRATSQNGTATTLWLNRFNVRFPRALFFFTKPIHTHNQSLSEHVETVWLNRFIDLIDFPSFYIIFSPLFASCHTEVVFHRYNLTIPQLSCLHASAFRASVGIFIPTLSLKAESLLRRAFAFGAPITFSLEIGCFSGILDVDFTREILVQNP